MKPYYEDEACTIYHGDCREVLPRLEPGAVTITDQPYGTGWTRGGGRQGEFKSIETREAWDVFSLDWLSLIPAPKRIAAFVPTKRLEDVCNALPLRAVCYYRKTNVRPQSVDREPIVVSPAPTNGLPWDFTTYNGDSPFHPCQKPQPLMRWLVKLVSDEGDTVVDPFMGSGSTLVAAKLLGRKAIGIEIEEKYCEVAAKRLAQGVLEMTA